MTTKKDDDLNDKDPAYQTDSSDDLKNLASLMKAKRAPKVANQSVENFERKCLKLLQDTTHQIESKITTHEENLHRLYRSVEQINEEIEPLENEAIFERIINKNFDEEINYLSRALTDMSSEKSCHGDESQIDSELLEERKYLSLFCPFDHAQSARLSSSVEFLLTRKTNFNSEVHVRPEQFAEFSRRMTYECKRGFRLFCENNKLASDARKFKEKYKALMREVL